MDNNARVTVLFEDFKRLPTHEVLEVKLWHVRCDGPYMDKYIMRTTATNASEDDPFIDRNVLIDEYCHAKAIRFAIKALDELEAEVIRTYTAED